MVIKLWNSPPGNNDGGRMIILFPELAELSVQQLTNLC
jgi:hypothetical protein